jgi:hypothetical protein
MNCACEYDYDRGRFKVVCALHNQHAERDRCPELMELRSRVYYLKKALHRIDGVVRDPETINALLDASASHGGTKDAG